MFKTLCRVLIEIIWLKRQPLSVKWQLGNQFTPQRRLIRFPFEILKTLEYKLGNQGLWNTLYYTIVIRVLVVKSIIEIRESQFGDIRWLSSSISRKWKWLSLLLYYLVLTNNIKSEDWMVCVSTYDFVYFIRKSAVLKSIQVMSASFYRL